MALTNEQLVHQMYIAYYQRPADPDGLAYWVNQIEENGGWEAVAGAFGNPENAEYDALYGNMSRAELIAELYQSVFGRAAVEEEVAFWEASEHSDQNLGFAIINGAQNEDKTLINNKVKFAELLAAEVETNDAYTALGENVKGLLDAVTAEAEVTAESVKEALAVANAETFTLAEALAIVAEGGELSEVYLLSDTALVLEAGTIAAVAEQVAAAQAIVDGADNAEELEFAPEFAIEDSVANVLAAAEEGNSLVADISLITLTDEAITLAQRDALVELGFDSETLPELDDASALLDALAGLNAAQAAKKAFLDVPGKTETEVESEINTAVTDADVAVGTTLVNGSPIYATTDTAGVKAAKVLDAQNDLAKNLAAAQKNVADAQEDIAEVAGLSSAISLYNARVEAAKATEAALVAPAANQAGALASYSSLNNDSAVNVNANGTVDGLIVLNAAGRLELASNVTEATNPGIGALLSAAQANVDAIATDAAADSAVAAAALAIGYLDFAPGAKTAMGAAFDPALNAEAAAKLTQADVQVELNKQVAAGGGSVLEAAKTAFETNPLADADLTEALTSALTIEAGVVKQISDLDKALATLDAAKEVQAELAGLKQAIEDAEEVFEELGLEAPVVVAGTVVGTADNDLFLVGSAGEIVNFNAQGEDRIYVGSEFSLLELTGTQVASQNVGSASALEIFVKESAAGLDLWVEKAAYAGNATGTTDLVQITLNGVSFDDLVLEDGFLAIA